MEITVPVRGKLIVRKSAREADAEGDDHSGSCAGRYRRQGKKVSPGVRAKLVALEAQKLDGHGIQIGYGHSKVVRQGGHISDAAVRRWNVRKVGADDSPRRVAALLTGALVVEEKETQLGIRPDGSTHTPTKNVLFDHRPVHPHSHQKCFVRHQPCDNGRNVRITNSTGTQSG